MSIKTYRIHISYFSPNVFQDFLQSDYGKEIQKIYVKGDDIRFGDYCFNRNGSSNVFQYYVDTNYVKTNLEEALGVTEITSIEDLEKRVSDIEDKIKEGTFFPEGLTFSKTSGLQITGMGNMTLTINPDSLRNTSALFDPETNKINTSLVESPEAPELPEGLSYSQENGLQIASDKGGQLTIYPGSLTSNKELLQENGQINEELYQASLPEGMEYDSVNHILKVGTGDDIGGLVLNNSLAITNLDQSIDIGTDNNLALLQPNRKYYQPKTTEE